MILWAMQWGLQEVLEMELHDWGKFFFLITQGILLALYAVNLIVFLFVYRKMRKKRAL